MIYIRKVQYVQYVERRETTAYNIISLPISRDVLSDKTEDRKKLEARSKKTT